MQYTTTLRVFGNGRITIPDFIREALKIKEGDLVKVIIERANEFENDDKYMKD